MEHLWITASEATLGAVVTKIFISECATECTHVFPQGEECSFSFWEDSKMYTPGTVANS